MNVTHTLVSLHGDTEPSCWRL